MTTIFRVYIKIFFPPSASLGLGSLGVRETDSDLLGWIIVIQNKKQ